MPEVSPVVDAYVRLRVHDDILSFLDMVQLCARPVQGSNRNVWHRGKDDLIRWLLTLRVYTQRADKDLDYLLHHFKYLADGGAENAIHLRRCDIVVQEDAAALLAAKASSSDNPK